MLYFWELEQNTTDHNDWYMKKVIYIWAKMVKIVNAYTWLADLATAIKHYQIWCASYQMMPI